MPISGPFFFCTLRKQNPAEFRSLISFAEVLDPASKAAILSLDSQVQMRGTVSSELQVGGWRRERQTFGSRQMGAGLVG